MAVPSALTLDMIAREVWRKAGNPSPTPNQMKIVKGDGIYSGLIEEVKHDIWTRGKKLKTLHTHSVLVTAQNQNTYSFPTDFSSDLTLTALHGNINGTAADGTASSITFAASDTSSTDSIDAHNILIYEGIAIASMQQCNSFDTTTRIASVSPDFNTTPENGDKYMVIDQYYPLEQTSLDIYDKEPQPLRRGTPSWYVISGDNDNCEFKLFKTPYHVSGRPFGLRLRYYADLMEIDLESTLIKTIYKRWRNTLIKGGYAKLLESNDDSAAEVATRRYEIELAELVSRETYGMDLTNMQQTVGD